VRKNHEVTPSAAAGRPVIRRMACILRRQIARQGAGRRIVAAGRSLAGCASFWQRRQARGRRRAPTSDRTAPRTAQSQPSRRSCIATTPGPDRQHGARWRQIVFRQVLGAAACASDGRTAAAAERPVIAFTYLGRQAAGGRLEVYLVRDDTSSSCVSRLSSKHVSCRVDQAADAVLDIPAFEPIQQLSIGVSD